MGFHSPDQKKKYGSTTGVPKVSPVTACVLSTLIVLSIIIGSVVWRPTIKALLREAHVDFDEGSADSVWHRQRQFVTAEEEVEMLQIMLAQKLERLDQEDDTDSDFMSSEGSWPDASEVDVVQMQEEAYRLDTVEKEGQYYGYTSNDGPIKVLEHPEWRLQKNETWMQPPSHCPGKPSTFGVHKGGPSTGVREELERAIELMVEGKVQLYKEGGGKKVIENRCLFLTRDCAQLNLPYGGPQAVKALNTTGEAFEELRTTVMVDLKPRSLGSCALVGNSQNLLKGHRGDEIDGHDTIFRHNTPVKGFEKAVGSRPASVIWVKSNYMKQSTDRAELMYDLLVGLDRLPRTLLYKGKPLLMINKGGEAAGGFAKERARWYRLAGGSKRKHPTGGFARAFNLLASGLCTRVDLYGFSFQPHSSGKYFDKKKQVIHTHMAGLEHWAYRYLMHKGKLCVYGD